MMRSGNVLFVTAVALLLAGGAAQADGLPSCRVRVVKSMATEAEPVALLKQVELWADARDRGCTLVSSIDEARRLAEPIRQRGTYRFAYTTLLDRRTKEHVAKELPTVLADVCFGYLPKVASIEQDRR